MVTSNERNYSSREMMVAACSREIKDFEKVFVGVGVPLLAAMVATKRHAPNAILFFEGGGVGAVSRRIPWTISDNPTTDNALIASEMWRLFGDTQAGYVDVGILGGAQIDKYGNLNTTVIARQGEALSYQNPGVRLPGSGGANDIASSCRRTIIIMGLEENKFVEKVDYITSPGFLEGGRQARRRAGLRWGGPVAVITNKCIFRFDPDTKEMSLDQVFEGVAVDEVRSKVGWDLKVADPVTVVEPPTAEELHIMRTMDPVNIILGSKSVEKAETFDEFFEKMARAYRSVEITL